LFYEQPHQYEQHAKSFVSISACSLSSQVFEYAQSPGSNSPTWRRGGISRMTLQSAIKSGDGKMRTLPYVCTKTALSDN